MSARYIIFFGTTPYEANFPMQAMARKLNFFRERGGKLVIVDPRFSNSAAKAAEWIPVLPGTDAAFGLGMMRWMMDHDRVDKRYLSFPNQKAAEVDGHLTWSNATYLVRQDNRKFLRPADAKLPGDAKPPTEPRFPGARFREPSRASWSGKTAPPMITGRWRARTWNTPARSMAFR